MNRIKAAPMVAISTANARKLMRLIHPEPILYTEMLIDNDVRSVVQIASNSPKNFILACTRLHEEFGYSSFNLNCGCPSTKVAGAGTLGAALMLRPRYRCSYTLMHHSLVSEVIHSAIDALPTCSFSVKCRIGIDSNDTFDFFNNFISAIMQPLAKESLHRMSFDIHARKAWLQGLSPKKNRTIPVINYEFVYQVSTLYPHTVFSINGDIKLVPEIVNMLQKYSGPIMIGRAVYENPMLLYLLALELDTETSKLSHVDKLTLVNERRLQVIGQYISYVDKLVKLADDNDSTSGTLNYSIYLSPLIGMYAGTPVSAFFKEQLHKLMNASKNNVFSFTLGNCKNMYFSQLPLFDLMELALLRTQKELKRFKFGVPSLK